METARLRTTLYLCELRYPIILPALLTDRTLRKFVMTGVKHTGLRRPLIGFLGLRRLEEHVFDGRRRGGAVERL